jgi:hypothetical protein
MACFCFAAHFTQYHGKQEIIAVLRVENKLSPSVLKRSQNQPCQLTRNNCDIQVQHFARPLSNRDLSSVQKK